MKWKEAILNLKPYQPGRSIDEVKRAYGLKEITKLASNENPFGCSEQAKEVMKNYESSLALYPDGNATVLRSAVSKHLGIQENNLIFGNGSDEIIQVIARSLLYPGVNTVMASPTFPQYKHNAVIEGAEVREVPLADGEHDLDGMLAAIDENTSVVWVCSPNNPTGRYIARDALVDFLRQVPQQVLVVMDEAYFEYVHADDYPDTIKLLEQFQNLIVLRTFSKIYGLASYRVGYGAAHSDLISRLDPAREPFNTNTIGQLAAAAALADQEFIAYCHEMNKKGLAQFYDFCEREGLKFYPSQGNFVLIDVKCQGDEAFQFLMEKGFIVRSGNALGFPTSIRITIGCPEQNLGVIEQLTVFLNRKK
ncbi:histidinol-phosphate aminotransferase [Peribacillus deserti]|uniref:Histidinol-phosphate aminotransferase n=1 Tax=Peribacillus deserti TaxID=673318 RepID=A0ABS2QHY7_9BACI|nr:histidinol-phosphate transaminase [Peribacillus deserti]MBM7692640.1 histidinol-phosphate aminotransferase [Peribacillus deserti]